MTDLKALIQQSRLNSVDDEFIGQFHFKTDTNWQFELREDFDTHFHPASVCEGQNNIALILESPHTYEFADVNLQLINSDSRVSSRPLNNPRTRIKLIDLLNGIFMEHLKNTLNNQNTYNLILINSIQFQCSLGEATNLLRDQVFLWSWIDLKTDFIHRISRLKPVYFINCCTKGTKSGSKEYLTNEAIKTFGLAFNPENYHFDVKAYFGKDEFTLQDVVERALELNRLITDANYFKYPHPSSRFETGYPSIVKGNKVNFSKKMFQIGTLQNQQS